MKRLHVLWITLATTGLVVSVYAKKPDEAKPTEPAEVALPQVSVQVHRAALRQSPGFLSEVAATLSYGDRIGIAEKQEDWRRVEAKEPSVSGWMHASALTLRTFDLTAGETDVEKTASKQEMTLGGRGHGRGFSEQIETEFRTENEELEDAYKLLDQLTQDPRRQVSRTEMLRFMREGGLAKGGGGS